MTALQDVLLHPGVVVAPGTGIVAKSNDEAVKTMRDAYTHYYESGLYEQRYPGVSPFLFSRVVRELDGCKRILDFGCGNGRYLLPLLEQTRAEIVGFDICPTAIEKTRQRLARHPQGHRVTLICGDFADCPEIDGAVSMFGVLSHIPGRAERIAILRGIRSRMGSAPRQRFVVSVPNALRRFWKANFAGHVNLVPRYFGGKPLEANDIVYSRVTAQNEVLWLYYHLYLPATLRADLGDAGYRVRSLSSESILTEFTITHSSRMARFDDMLRRVLPPSLGYGLLAVAD